MTIRSAVLGAALLTAAAAPAVADQPVVAMQTAGDHAGGGASNTARGRSLHLGSTGCASASRTTAPAAECAISNRVAVRFDAFDPALLAAGPSLAWTWDIPAWPPPPAVPADNPMSAAKVALGRRLLHDARLSADGTVACASCHAQERAFTDGRETAEGVGGAQGRRDAMALGATAYMPTPGWANPTTTSLERHALIPLFGEAPVEMGMAGREAALFARLAADPWYADAFPAAVPGRDPAVSLYTITRALAAFQRTLFTADSPHDRWKHGGDEGPVSEAARRGEALFLSHRFECHHRHGGFAFPDNRVTARSACPESAVHNTGLCGLGPDGAYPPGGQGLCDHRFRAADMGRFRTPSPRNVAVTAPCMHDGSVATLRDAIRCCAAGGRTISDGPHAGRGRDNRWKDPPPVGLDATEVEIDDLNAFLESLTARTFLTNPAFADPWPADHPAASARRLPAAPDRKDDPS